MPPEGGGGWGSGGKKRGIDLLLLYRDTRQVLSDPPPPPHPLSLSFPLSTSKVGLFPDLSDLGETANLPQSPDWACLLPQAPRSDQVHCIPSTTTPVSCKIVVGRGREGGLWTWC